MNYKSFLINLDRRPDRLAAASAELDAAGIPFTRFPALEFSDKGNFPSLAARGCTESHINVLDENRNGRPLLIMEDDIFFSKNFTSLFPVYLDMIEKLPDWDLVTFYNSNFPPISDVPYLYNFCSWCCHFYLVNGKSVGVLADLLWDASTIIDNEFFVLFRDRKLSFWSTAQQLVFQNYDLHSDIDPSGVKYFKEGHLQGIYISKTKYRKETP